MAQNEALQQVIQYAKEESMLAALEGRMPDRGMLDELGRLALPDFAPVLVKAPAYYYRSFNDPAHLRGDKAASPYLYEKITDVPSVGGRFGGFSVETIFDASKEPEYQNAVRLSYFVMDTNYKDIGYVCPVDDAELYDVCDTLPTNDPFIEDVHTELAQDEPNMQKVNKLVGDLRLDGPNIGLYSAYIKSVITPSEVYKNVFAYASIFIDANKEGATTYDGYKSFFTIDKTDTFAFIGTGGSFGELVIKKGTSSRILIPISWIVGYEPSDREP